VHTWIAGVTCPFGIAIKWCVIYVEMAAPVHGPEPSGICVLGTLPQIAATRAPSLAMLVTWMKLVTTTEVTMIESRRRKATGPTRANSTRVAPRLDARRFRGRSTEPPRVKVPWIRSWCIWPPMFVPARSAEATREGLVTTSPQGRYDGAADAGSLVTAVTAIEVGIA
jgi:hypothetical protein